MLIILIIQIIVQTIYDDKPRLFIFHNTITNPRIGIHTSQLYKPCIGDYDREDGHGLQPGTDTIRFDLGSVSDYTEGILVQGCSYSKVVNNIIKNIQQAFDENSGGNLFRGMEFNLCDHSFINCNKIDSISRSIYFEGDCNFSRMRLNVMTDFEYGVEIADNSVNLPEQGDVYASDTVPYDNEWVEGIVSVERVHNDDVTPVFINWYYDGAANRNPDPTGMSFSVASILVSQSCNCDCGTFDEGGEEQRSMSMGRIINNLIPFNEYSNEKGYQAKMNVFKSLKENQNIIYQGKPDDYVYEDFYNDMNSGNMGLFDSICTVYNDSNGLIEAIALNNAVNDTNNVEYNLKTVNDIFLNKVAFNIELTAVDSSVLNYVTTLPLSITGKAKYMAAAILKKEVHEQNQSNQQRQIKHSNKKSDDVINIYPNPVKNEIFVTVPFESIDDKYTFNVYDAKGNKVVSGMLTDLTTKVSLKQLVQGQYQYVISNKKNIAKGKITIVR